MFRRWPSIPVELSHDAVLLASAALSWTGLGFLLLVPDAMLASLYSDACLQSSLFD